MGQVKVGVIGVGHLGKLHASLYKDVPDAELIGVFDNDEKKCKATADELNVKAFSNLVQMFEAVEAVNIVTPTTTHYDIASQALSLNKHVFIEKPITKTEEEAQELIRLAQSKNKIIQVGHIERFNAAMLALTDVPLEPLFIEAHRLASFNPRGTDVAVILDLMIHDLDLILHMVKSKPVKISASGVGVISANVDIANARIEFENGCVANITASRLSAKKMRKMRIFQKNAYISMDFSEGFSEIFYIPGVNQEPFRDGTLAMSLGQLEEGTHKRDIKYNRLERKNVNPLQMELAKFVECIKNDIEPVITAKDGLEALKLANLVLKEIGNHQQIVEKNMVQPK
ncbi:MAG: Gfo/Idh/MocA family oxidoreductase [Calditrichaceae bacterium]|nr:Gfo/Idh/MocA family oxidoreductase [Calditrichaceae bacterium]